jgi:hypothetical protein
VTVAAAGAAAIALALTTSAQAKSLDAGSMCFVDLIVPPVDAARDVCENVTGALPLDRAGRSLRCSDSGPSAGSI